MEDNFDEDIFNIEKKNMTPDPKFLIDCNFHPDQKLASFNNYISKFHAYIFDQNRQSAI